MSDDREQREDDEREGQEGGDGLGGRVLSASPLIWVLLAAAVGWAVWSTLSGGGAERPAARVVVIAGAERERTLVALPCGATSSDSTGDASPPGAITAVLPAGADERVVAVSGCQSGGSSATGSLTGGGKGATVLVLLPPGTRAPRQGAEPEQSKRLLPGLRATSVTRVSAGDAETILIPPCPGRRASGDLASGYTRPSGGGVMLVGCPQKG